MIRLLKTRRGAVKSITLDPDSEFACHEWGPKAVNASVYFYDAYCSGQRGANENTSGLIRQYFPKATDFQQITDVEVRRVVNELNDRPRKCLGYKTSVQVFLGEYSGALNAAGAALISRIQNINKTSKN